MRTEGETRGNGPASRVRLPTPDWCYWFTKTWSHGSYFRWRYGELNFITLKSLYQNFKCHFGIHLVFTSFSFFQLDEINQLFIPHCRNKLLWYYQEVEELERNLSLEMPKPSTSRAPTQPLKAMHNAVPIKKKKLFLTDGWGPSLTGICIFMYRLNTNKQLPEESFQKVRGSL